MYHKINKACPIDNGVGRARARQVEVARLQVGWGVGVAVGACLLHHPRKPS